MISTAPLLPKLRQSREQLGKSNESLSKRQSIATETTLILNLGHSADKLPPAPNKPFYIEKLPTTLRHKAPCLPRIDSSIHPSNRDPVHDAIAPMQIRDKDMLLGTKWLLQNLHSGKITSLPEIYDYPACMSVYKPGLRGWATGYFDFRGDDPHHTHYSRDFEAAADKAPESIRLHASGKTTTKNIHDSVSKTNSTNQQQKGTKHGLAKLAERPSPCTGHSPLRQVRRVDPNVWRLKCPYMSSVVRLTTQSHILLYPMRFYPRSVYC
ncbi:hypothetical protein HDU81_011035 [Chytriomyces hyalinus]|nr:hypothetical protein HDU81_011035 [Chytriomyces hyalinus]